MKLILLCSLIYAMTCTVALPEPARVSVHGNRFVTNNGTAIVFRGINSSDPDKLDRNGQLKTAYFAAIKSWGANIVRLPVHPSAWRIRGRDEYLKLLDRSIALAREQGLYVIIDWHSIGNLQEEKFLQGSSELYPPGLYNTTKAETLEFWRTMAARYGDNPTVAFFELFNEPADGGNLGKCSWEDWKQFMEQVIAAIRENGCVTVPLVAGFNYGYDLKPVATAPINAKGIGYVSHPYPMKREKPWEAKWTQDWGYLAEKYPLFLSEIGFCYPEDKNAHIPVISDESYVEAISAYCNPKGISYAIWCFDPHWSPCLIEDWTFKPTRHGEYFRKAMLAQAAE
ncbi:MAG TPA: cellulase family glycosylhydrolase [Verrucomicrobiota bacterium]|nr:cellulase family glycosylhydrolase [Verrucomicrobiota bacterium]